jgi:hypothetical protein
MKGMSDVVSSSGGEGGEKVGLYSKLVKGCQLLQTTKLIGKGLPAYYYDDDNIISDGATGHTSCPTPFSACSDCYPSTH